MITDNEDKSYGKGLITLLTSLWSCPDNWRVELKSIRQENRTLNSPTPNILCATTPDWMQLKEADVLGGFLGRFLPIYADGKSRKLLPRRLPMDSLKFDSLLIRLKEIRSICDVVYGWDEEAGKIFDGLYGEWDSNFKKEKNSAQLQPYWSRVDTHIRKLAMIFDICSEKPTYTITKDNLERANLFMEVITGYYRQMLCKLTYSRDDKKEQQIVDMLKKVYPKGVKHADIMRNLHLKAKDMESLMNTLQQKEIIELKDEQLSRKKGKVYYFIG
jgi:predicted transcriptional regulator